MKSKVLLIAGFFASIAGAGEWQRFDDANWISGPKVSAEKLKGRIVMIERWGINCPPCRASLPHVQALAKKYKDKGVVVIGAHFQGRDDAKIKDLLKTAGAEFPVYQYAGYSEAPSTRGIPAPYIVDHTGKVVYSNVGFNASAVEAALEEAVKAAPELGREVMLSEIEGLIESRPGKASVLVKDFLKKNPKEKAAVAKFQARLKDPKVNNLAKLEEELIKLQSQSPKGPAAVKKRSDTAKTLARKAKALGADYLESDFNSLCE